MLSVILNMKKYIILAIATTVFFLASRPPDQAVVFLDIGQGSSILVQNKDCQILIDTGNYYKATHALGKFLPKHDKQIEHVIITHFDTDHYAGIYNLLQRYKIEQIIFHHFAQLPNSLEGLTQLANIKDNFVACGAKFTRLWPDNSKSPSSTKNENSIVLDMIFNGHKFLFTGDIGCQTESLITLPHSSYDVMQAGHHGSKHSNCLGFLQRVSPSYLITQAGKNNRYGHPHPQIDQRANLLNITHLRTDQLSNIVFDVGSTTIQASSSQTVSQTKLLDRFLESRV